MTLIEPTQDMPLFNLHSPKLGTNRDGEATLEFSYSQTRPGKNLLPDVIIRLGNSEQGQKMIFGAIANTLQPFRVRLPPERLKQVKSEGVEILFIGELWSITGNLGSRQSHHHYFKLSNSILLGSAREQATTRPPNPQDQNAVAKWLEREKQQEQFDATVPEGFARKLSLMAPGMTIRVFTNSEWRHAEYLGEDDDGLIVYRPDATKRETALIESFLVARKLSDLEYYTNPELSSKPKPFKASLRLMDSSSIIIPDDHEITSRDAYIPGMPVKVRIKNELVEGYILSTMFGEATVRFMGLDVFNKAIEKKEVVAKQKMLSTKSDLALLQTPNGKFDFASNLAKPLSIPESWQKPSPKYSVGIPANGAKKTKSPQDTGSPERPANSKDKSSEMQELAAPVRKVKRYPMGLPIPRGMQIVTSECPLQPGVQLGCNWGSKWYPVTVLQLYDDGAVRIRWDTFGEGFDADQLREDLIISDPHLKKLQRTANSPTANPREWSDLSGKFKIIARFVELDGDTVVLQKTNQQTIRVPVEKLSEKDKETINKLSQPTATKN